MHSTKHNLISRSSSTTLSMAGRPSAASRSSEDQNIAQALLTTHKTHARQDSSTTSVSLRNSDGVNRQSGHFNCPSILPLEGQIRRGRRPSNTWTSSSGEVFSETDEVDDRSVFIHEYNRLAKKVEVAFLYRND